MQFKFDIAIFGDKGNEHGLLQATSEHTPKGLVTRTDLPIDLPESDGYKPMLAGFSLDGHYIFTSTIRDVDANRGGMVRTIALFAPVADIMKLSDLGAVFSELSRRQEINDETEPLTISITSANNNKTESNQPAAIVFDLLASENPKLPIVWEGFDGFDSVVVELWKMLPKKARSSFQFRTACRPSDGTSNGFDLVCSPKERISRWNGFQVIRPPFVATSTSSNARSLLNPKHREDIYAFANELGMSLESLEELHALARCYSSFENMSNNSDLDVTTLFRTVARLAPKPTSGKKIKDAVCEALVSRVKAGSVETFKFLRNLSADAYPNGFAKISSACNCKFIDLLANSNKESTQLVREAIRTAHLPWPQGVLNATKKALADCVPTATLVFVELLNDLEDAATGKWIHNAAATTTSLEDSILTDAKELVCGNASPKLLDFCRRYDWFRLHAHVGSEILTPSELLRQQATMTNGLATGAAELSSVLGASCFAEESAKSDIEAYWTQVANDCQKDSGLFSNFEFRSSCWRHVFCQFAKRSFSMPISIQGLSENVIESWQAIANGDLVDPQYVHALSQSKFASVLSVPARASIWNRLEVADRNKVLEETAKAWFQDAGDASSKATDIEPLLRSELLAKRNRELLLPANAQTDLRAALDVFEAFNELGEEEFAEFRVRYLSKNLHLTETNSSLLGDYVQRRGWWRLAKALLDDYKRYNRKDLFPALQACRDQYNVLTRFRYGISEGRIPKDAWWMEAVEVLSSAYPSGPAHNSLWTRANGEPSEIPLDGSGKDRWAQAIDMLKRRRSPKKLRIENLLWQVREDAPKDEEVNALIDHCPFALNLARHEPFVD